jgi:integrase
MRKLITDTLLRQKVSQPREKPFEILDAKLQGFLLRVQPSGVRTYYQRTGRTTRSRIGGEFEVSADEARDLAKRIVGNLAAGLPALAGIRAEGVTLEAFLDGDYQIYATAHLRNPAKTIQQIKAAWKPFLAVPLAGITAEAVTRHQARRKAIGRRDSSLLRDLAGLSAVLSKAVKPFRLIDANPIKDVDKPKVDRRPKVRYLSPAEDARLRAALAARDRAAIEARSRANAWRKARSKPALAALACYADHLTPAVLLSMNCGLRRGELFGLTWSNVDLKGAVLTVEAATAKGRQTRHIPLNSEAVTALTQWRKQCAGERVFPFETSFKTAWSALLEAAKITAFRWHDLRHHFGSRLVQAGVPLNTVRELLGHQSIGMTLRYAHLAPDQKAEAVARLVQA